MKTKVTAKYVKETAKLLQCPIIEVGYCGIQSLLHYHSPTYYTAGLYGWNADVYLINGAFIVTGYRPFGTIHNYALSNAYEASARKILDDYTVPYKERTEKVESLLAEFVEEMKRGCV